MFDFELLCDRCVSSSQIPYWVFNSIAIRNMAILRHDPSRALVSPVEERFIQMSSEGGWKYSQFIALNLTNPRSAVVPQPLPPRPQPHPAPHSRALLRCHHLRL